jgi:ketosteroid isomerase-like protein
VVRVYDDDSEASLAAGEYTLSQPDMGLPILQEITVSSGAFKASFYIQVLNTDGVFQGIELASPPSKLTYYLGEVIDPAGMVLNAVYSDGSRAPIGAYVLTGYDRFKRGTQTVSVSANNRTTTFEANFRVPASALGWLNFYKAHWTLPTENYEENLHRVAYIKGEAFDFEKFNLQARVELKSEGVDALELGKIVTLSAGNGLYPEDVVDVPDFSTPGTKTITVKLDEMTPLTTTVLVIDVEPEVYFDYGYWRHSLESNPGWGKNMTGAALGDGTYTVSLGRSLVLAPVRFLIGYNKNHESLPVSYSWTVSGGSYDTTVAATSECFTFTPKEAGKTYRVSVTVSGPTYLGGTVSKTAETKVQCFALPAAPPDVVDSEKFSMDNSTAPIRNFGPGQMNSPISTGYMWSLGSALGYEIWKLRKIQEGDTTFEIRGNPFGGWSEPGIVWVAMDENGDGLPNDTWYELTGSDDESPTYRNLVTRRYAIRHVQERYWVDSKGRTGMTYGGSGVGLPSGVSWVTYTGTLIRDNGNFTNGYNGIETEWGYVDTAYTDFHISHARQQDGSPANLPWIDFVKVQTAIFRYAGIFGEVSTELYSAEGLGKQTDFPLPEES